MFHKQSVEIGAVKPCVEGDVGHRYGKGIVILYILLYLFDITLWWGKLWLALGICLHKTAHNEKKIS